MVLPASCGPDSSEFSETDDEGKVAPNTEDEAVEEGDRPARWQDKPDGSGESDPSAM